MEKRRHSFPVLEFPVTHGNVSTLGGGGEAFGGEGGVEGRRRGGERWEKMMRLWRHEGGWGKIMGLWRQEGGWGKV